MHLRILTNLSRAPRLLCKFCSNNHAQRLTSSQFSGNKKGNYSNETETRGSVNHNLTATINKYEIFQDETDVILDVAEEQQKIHLKDLEKEPAYDPYADIDLTRGTTGVIEIEQLVTLLEREKAKNIFVASVPKDYAYVNYIVVVTAKSQKHMSALITFVRKVHKLKRHPTDLIPNIEGKHSKDWMALDLGNIALHVFSQSAREKYDLETLWTVGSQFDDQSIEPENLNIMDQYNAILADLEPADTAQ